MESERYTQARQHSNRLLIGNKAAAITITHESAVSHAAAILMLGDGDDMSVKPGTAAFSNCPCMIQMLMLQPHCHHRVVIQA